METGGVRNRIVYLFVAVLIILVVVFAVILSPPQFTPAYILDESLDDVWSESFEDRDSGSNWLGLERWYSFTYTAEGRYPANLTVTTFKTLVMLNEDELMDKTVETIEKALKQGIAIDNGTRLTGERTLKNDHRTMYIIYDGNDTSKDPSEKIKVIGEVWNCGTSGTSIICIGVAQVTDNVHGNSEVNNTLWSKIVRDENGFIGGFAGQDGLIYNVRCH